MNLTIDIIDVKEELEFLPGWAFGDRYQCRHHLFGVHLPSVILVKLLEEPVSKERLQQKITWNDEYGIHNSLL